ncbi:hypothetical protein XAP412_490002 [Xanthomonas phaseoli pv. phaseoli]|uniref:Uncharacterized protein n=1 Tax=Xanthomonas campestris pv. phaseoli TaxID=317013 RepID=A0ABY1TUI5_XANCH|nr:hypothetical protein XAP6984_540002 [Xanthomonas phaseoli pv. phaseoli]SON86641.1 hypothetical protein XAP412_490002 [Xanthomonas phaseoli pv. phaseoli]
MPLLRFAAPPATYPSARCAGCSRFGPALPSAGFAQATGRCRSRYCPVVQKRYPQVQPAGPTDAEVIGKGSRALGFQASTCPPLTGFRAVAAARAKGLASPPAWKIAVQACLQQAPDRRYRFAGESGVGD